MEGPLNILIIDDEPDVRLSLANFLGKLGHSVICAEDGVSGLREFHTRDLDLVITDIRMPAMDGLELLRQIKKIEMSPVDVIVITGHGDMDNAIAALKYGAFDYLQKPLNVRELAILIERSREYAALRNQYFRLKKEFEARLEHQSLAIQGEAEQLRKAYLQEIGLDEMCVYSESMREVMRKAEKYSTDRSVPVLIEGESGTGKELIARYVHHYAQENPLLPFVAINCGALPKELFESELFGHEPGAFTGATRTGRAGKLESASGGTVFLDEIGEMPLQLQVILLRVIEEKKLYRLGGVNEKQIDVRFICASNKNLKLSVSENNFRMDFYYRISTGYIYIPALRDQKEAILPLAHHFISRAFMRKGKRFECFTKDAEKLIVECSWPGNVRQLKNTVERLALMKSDGRIDAEDLSFIRDATSFEERGPGRTFVLGREDFDLPAGGLNLVALNDRIIRQALAKNKGNQTRTAEYLGISRRVLQGYIKKIGIC
jgi:two-component system response regulator AtoC